MKARIIRFDPAEVEPSKITEISRILGRDGTMVYPTDTLYGIGANCDSRKAVRKIFAIKKRPAGKGMPVLVSDAGMAEELGTDIPPVFYRLAARFWPGPLTLVVKAASSLPPTLTGPGKTIGIRLPSSPWIRELIRKTEVPLIATSANISGEGEISSGEEAIRLFGDTVDLIVDGGRTSGLLPSTVVSLAAARPVLLREGAIPKTKLARYLTSPWHPQERRGRRKE